MTEGLKPRLLWRRYVLALGAVVVLMITDYVLQRQEKERGDLQAEVVSVALKQSERSRRIADLVDRFLQSGAPYARLELAHALYPFEAQHRWIVQTAVLSPAARALYFGADGPHLNGQTLAFARLVRDVAAMPPGSESARTKARLIRHVATGELLDAHDRAVALFEQEAEQAERRALRVHGGLLFLSLAIVAAEALFIFWPAQAAVNRALDIEAARRQESESRNVALAEAKNRLEHAATHDPLTGLANRKKLHADLTRRLETARAGFCVMHIDLDRFKEVNDTLGHPVGDAVLRRVAEIMRSQVRSGDLVARVGGDEFVILLDIGPEEGAARVEALAEAIIARVREPMVIDGHTCAVGASAGYAFATTELARAERLIADADIALYASKRGGRGRATAFAPEMRAEIEERHAMMRDLERALEAGEFVAHFQPQVRLEDGAVIGAEALCRWHHPDRGLLVPAAFVPLAEEAGLIDMIDARVMFDALDLLAGLRHEGIALGCVAINVSSRSLRNRDFGADLLMALSMRGLAPGDVAVEVQESSLIEGARDRAAETMRDLADAGVGLYLDDFGTGYSALSTLSLLDLAGLKIDRTLVDNLDGPGGAKARTVVGAVIGLAADMGLSVTAEGVETVAQRETLRALGCARGQGYLFGRPVPREGLVRSLAEGAGAAA